LIWSLNPLSTFSWRRWDDEWVVFDQASGDTHQLAPIAAVMLMCFEREPRDLPALTAEVAAELDLPADDSLSNKAAEIVDQLIHLGLIEPSVP
jgi:PqqD family protein of HPr-rel-A system